MKLEECEIEGRDMTLRVGARESWSDADVTLTVEQPGMLYVKLGTDIQSERGSIEVSSNGTLKLSYACAKGGWQSKTLSVKEWVALVTGAK
jgi:hypothetical protein